MDLMNSPQIQDSFTPINLALYISVPISAAAGSPTLAFRQPLITGHIFSSAGVLVGAELFLILAKYILKLESISTVDLQTNQIIQMPMKEFHEFLKTITGNNTGITQSIITPPISAASSSTNPITPFTSGSRGFIQPLPPEAPLVISLLVTSDFSNMTFSPNLSFFLPVIAFPGLRGSLPIILLSLLATILIRAVVSPQTTGAKPLSKPGEQANSSLNFSPEDLLRFLSRFGKYFSSH
ncbi:hypothetical protein ACHOLT_13805 [Desulfitobacterium sp. Sab5]|uniref:hypothetical protein n=1 Tax=Desulfitobacterium nosdiversum TaxID=3375356 RepID=UPI003CF3F88C